MRVDIFTLFPEAFAWFLHQVHVVRAREELRTAIELHDYRAFTPLRHGQVDDTPYGGGAGMVLRIDVVCAALEAVFQADAQEVRRSRRVVELTPRGRQLTDGFCGDLVGHDLVVLCGRYEGIDERVGNLVTDRLSVGPYVLSGGELAAMTLLDAVVRKIAGAVSNPESVASDSFAAELGGALEHPHYTRPAEYRGWTVPDVLLSGHHGEIARWRRERLVDPRRGS